MDRLELDGAVSRWTITHSLTASATWRLNKGGYIEGNIIRRKHQGKPNLEPFCKSVQREIIDGFQKSMRINTELKLPWAYVKKRIRIKCSADFYEIVGIKKYLALPDVSTDIYSRVSKMSNEEIIYYDERVGFGINRTDNEVVFSISDIIQ